MVTITRGSSVERVTIPPKPTPDSWLPEGKEYVLEWRIRDTVEKTALSSFMKKRDTQAQYAESLKVQDKIRGATKSRACVMTSDEMAAELDAKKKEKEEKEREKAERDAKKAAKSANPPAAKKPRTVQPKGAAANVSSGSESESDSDLHSKLDQADRAQSDDESVVEEIDHSRLMTQIKKLALQIDENVKEKFFAVYFDKHYYWGKAQMVEYEDEESDLPKAVVISFLERKQQSGITTYIWPPEMTSTQF